MFCRVLIGLDESPAAWRALQAAIALAQRDGARLTILTAVPPVRGWPGGPVETVSAARQLDAELEERACALVQRALAVVPDCLPVTTLLRRERPLRALLDRIAEADHDVLVLGDDGRRPLLPWRSLTRALQRRAGVPVLVLGDGGHVGARVENQPSERRRRSRVAAVNVVSEGPGAPPRRGGEAIA
jgi:nucleotide-binding universal stress UspA family protein